MKFVDGMSYHDRENNYYLYVGKSGSLPKFQTADGHMIVQHPSGRYRWDDVDHPRDLIG